MKPFASRVRPLSFDVGQKRLDQSLDNGVSTRTRSVLEKGSKLDPGLEGGNFECSGSLDLEADLIISGLVLVG